MECRGRTDVANKVARLKFFNFAVKLAKVDFFTTSNEFLGVFKTLVGRDGFPQTFGFAKK